jgi:type II secretory pathway pseudopilin PulG
MGIRVAKGFSIIEVILFLGITGLVMAVLLAGVGTALNRERYHDAVNSFQDYLQGQYSLAANVNNSRESTTICKDGKIIVDGTADMGRGTSDCTIVGRVLYSTSDGRSVNSAQVYATVDAADLSGDDDAQVLRDAKLAVSPEVENFIIGWSTELVPQGGSSPSVFSILIVRTPTNGQIHTYVLSETDKDPADIVGNVAAAPGLRICVSNPGLMSGNGRTGITLTPDAVNSSGVLFAKESECA